MFTTSGRKQHWQTAEAFTWMALGHKGSRVKLGNLKLESVDLPHQYAPCDLTLFMTEDVKVSVLATRLNGRECLELILPRCW
jgi:hypothetical protein